MSKQSSSSEPPSNSGVVVDGHHTSNKKPKGLKKLTQKKYGKHTLVAIIFALVGVAGLFYASAATTTTSLWTNNAIPKTLSDTDSKSVELGVKFQSSKAGKVTGVKFYKSAQNTGTHTGTLWDSAGNKLATVTFSNETASGWQTANFPQPVNIASGVTYVISYHAPKGHYSVDEDYFSTKGRTNGILTAPANSSASPNGVYAYSGNTTFPTNGYKATNYWVDVIVQTDLIGSSTAPAPPTQVSASQVGNTIVVNWGEGTSSNGITKYRIYKNNNYLMAVGVNPRTFVDTNVQAGKTYTYQIKTVDANGTGSVRSIVASATFNLTPPPTCPAGQTGTPPNCVTTTDQPTPPGSCGKLVRTSDTCMIAASAPALSNPTVYGSPGAPVSMNLTSNLSNAIVYGCIAVKANNVTISNVLVNDGSDGVHWTNCVGGISGGNGGGQAIISGGNPSTGVAVTGLVLNHVKVMGNNARGIIHDGSPDSAISCANCTLQNVDASGTGHVVTPFNNTTIRDSIIHNAGCASADGYPASNAQHINGIYADTISGLTVNNTYIQVTCTYSVTAGFSFNDTYASGGSMTLTNSYVEGGAGYSLDGPGHGHGHTGPIVVTDNVIVGPPLSKGAIGHLPFSTNQTFARNVNQNGAGV